jgi:antitoxin component YwqK of YwqJK toxin-antitoxin module
MAQDFCFCDSYPQTNFKDTSYYDGNLVEYSIDKKTQIKYVIKSYFSIDTHTVYFQINNLLLNEGEACGWYKNGKLKLRFLYHNDTLIGTNNFMWYENGTIQMQATNKSDTIISTFFDQDGILWYKEVSFGGLLMFKKIYYLNGNVKEFRDYTGHGELVLEFYSSGLLKSMGRYLYSQKIGKYTELYEDSSIRKIQNYSVISKPNEKSKVLVQKTFKKGSRFERLEVPK